MTFQVFFPADGGRNEVQGEGELPLLVLICICKYILSVDRQGFRKYSPRRLCFRCLTVVDAGQTRESVAEEMKTGESWKLAAHKMKKAAVQNQL